MLETLLWLVFLPPVINPTPCVAAAGAVEMTVPKGTSVQMCFETPIDPNIKYFRLRHAQTQEGFYDFWQRIYPTDCISTGGITYCGLVFPANRTEHYFVTTVYDDGTGALRETVGSQHARVTVTP